MLLKVALDAAPGRGLERGNVDGAARRALAPVGPVLDSVIERVLTPLGQSLGEADVTVYQVLCPGREAAPVLVGQAPLPLAKAVRRRIISVFLGRM